MRSLLIVALLVFSLGTSDLVAETESRCSGGDGGTPFADITSGFKFHKEIVPTDGLIKEFVYWDQKETIAYRNERNEILTQNVNEGSKPQFLAQSNLRMARVVDSLEQYLVTAHFPWFLDASKSDPMWVHYDTPEPIAKHLYWNGDTLYSLANTQGESGKQRLNVLSYRAGQTFSQSCNLFSPAGEVFYVADGNEYPYVYLYSTRSTVFGTKLHQYRVRLSEMGSRYGKCELEDLKFYHDALPGDVKGVYHFSNPNPEVYSFAVSVDHPTKSLLWDNGQECSYLNLKGRAPIVLNPKLPIVATWSTEEGLGLHYLNAKQEVKLLKGILKQPVTQENLWMTNEGNRLFVAAQPLECEARMLMQVALPKLPESH